MDPREIDTLVQRLVQDPQDQEALAYAHGAGQSDPGGYATVLERIGMQTADPTTAAYWLSEAANVWSVALGDAHRAAQILMMAVDKDPTASTAADRLATLYRERGDLKPLAALTEHRAKALLPYIDQDPAIRATVADLYEQLGRLWSEAPLTQPRKALEHFRRAMELNPASVYSIYAAREIYKQASQWADAISLYDREHAVVDDPARRLALCQDEAAMRKQAGDLAGAAQVLRNARAFAPEDVSLVQEIGQLITDRIKAGEAVSSDEREEASGYFLALAESYGGEHGLLFSLSALDAQPGNDRAIQLAAYFGEQLGRMEDLPARWRAYLASNPGGAMSAEVRAKVAASGPVPPPPPPGGAPAKSTLVSERRTSTPPPARQKAESVSALDELSELSKADAASPERLRPMLAAASEAASKGNRAAAFTKYKEVLGLDPSNSEALAWVKDHLRQKRLYGDLRDTLVAASRGGLQGDEKKQVLRELAGLCEQQLRDVDGAIQAWKQVVALDRDDASAIDALRRLLEKASRWDDLASVLEEAAMSVSDREEKLSLEKKLATIHETKRKDPLGAAEAWARIATIVPEDDEAVWTAVKLFEKAERPELAAQAIEDVVGVVEDAPQKGKLFERLGELRDKAGDKAAAADAWAEAARVTESGRLWTLAEDAYVSLDRLADAAQAADARAELSAGDPREQAKLYARAADHFSKAGDPASALARLEQAVELDPSNDEVFAALEREYVAADRHDDLANVLLARADAVSDKGQRKDLRLRAAAIQRDQMDNADASRETLLKILADGDDFEALSLLVDDAEAREEYQEATSLLARLAKAAVDTAKKCEVRLKEARMLSERLDDVESAVARYESILADLDPNHAESLFALAELEERRDNPRAAASALERALPGTEAEKKVETARRLAELYTGPLSDDDGAMRALEVLVMADEEDFDALARLAELTERAERWERTAELLKALLEVEGDEEESSRLARKVSQILDERLDKGDEALAVLEGPADDGDAACRDAYVELGDRKGWKGVVATKLVAWYEGRGASAEKTAALRGAFDRLADMGRDQEAARVAAELARAKGADVEIAKKLEEIGRRAKDLEALATAHDLLSRDLSGLERARELVRQAEIQLDAGVSLEDALVHGEGGLASVPASEVDPLLTRLATLAPDEAVDIYERQVTRTKAPADKLRALARAAEVAAQRGALERARGFFELALAGGVQDDVVAQLEEAAKVADGDGEKSMTRILADALAAGGGGSRDGGRTKSALLRRAARLADEGLGDLDKAFGWLGDALVAHVDASSLDALESLGDKVSDLARVEATISRALGEVFDGPLVRQLLARRAELRQTKLGNRVGAAEDLKKLHDLAPTDVTVMEQLGELLTELGDHRGMVQVLEDQILRGKDPAVRAELARKVAVLWEERLGDAREAADAWRRVLRMKSGDPEAQAGLERAKSNMLKKPADGEGPSVAIKATSLAPPAPPGSPPSRGVPQHKEAPALAPIGPSAPTPPPSVPAASASTPPPSAPVPSEPTPASGARDARSQPPSIHDEPTAFFDVHTTKTTPPSAASGESAAEDPIGDHPSTFDDEPTRVGSMSLAAEESGEEEMADVDDVELLEEIADDDAPREIAEDQPTRAADDLFPDMKKR